LEKRDFHQLFSDLKIENNYQKKEKKTLGTGTK